jgi:hypothetical protein
VSLQVCVLPGHEQRWDRVLLSLEDVSTREQARAGSSCSERYAQGLFEHSPVSLWVEISALSSACSTRCASRASRIRVFTDVHPEFVDRCMAEIRVIDVNRDADDVPRADKPTLLQRLPEIFRDEMRRPFTEQLIELWAASPPAARDGQLRARRRDAARTCSSRCCRAASATGRWCRSR